MARVAAMRGDFSQARLLGETSAGVLEAIQHRDAGEVRGWLDAIVEKAKAALAA